MPKQNTFQRIVEQETMRIIGLTPDNEVRHDWPTIWRGVAGVAMLELTTVDPPVWRLFSYVPSSDERGLHPITSYHYTYDGHILTAAHTEATMKEMADGIARERIWAIRETDAAIPLPNDYLRLATLLQQAPPIQVNPSQIIVG